jgi:hypothetical protein
MTLFSAHFKKRPYLQFTENYNVITIIDYAVNFSEIIFRNESRIIVLYMKNFAP